MILTDTHTHLYLDAFEADRDLMINRAFNQGIRYMLLPNINSQSIVPMLGLCEKYPENIFPMMGLHPTDVKADYQDELEIVESWLTKRKFYAVGETGIDLYWDKTFLMEQKIALKSQIALAKKYQLPIVLHSRDSFEEIFEVIDETIDENLTGVFHCFSGNREQAEKIISWGFKLGIGGVLTFKNSGLDKAIADIPLEHLILETDSPFLAPNPHRGKRNESSYLRLVAEKLAEIKSTTISEIAAITTKNAIDLFHFPIKNFD
jgi:TatD DNase family protein